MSSKHSKAHLHSKKGKNEETASESSEAEYASDLSVSGEEMSELDGSEDGELYEEGGEEVEEDEEQDLDMEEMAANRVALETLIASAQGKSSGENESAAPGKSKNRGKGLVYIARIPPAMNQHQLRTLLAPYGEIGRIWVETPEAIAQDKTISKGKAAKLSRKMSKEGWVEFERAKKAYKAAKLLHCQPMGAGRFKHDLWTIKYLKDFSWHDLLNQHLHRRKMRDERLRQSISRAKLEATKFMENRSKQEFSDNKKKRPRSDDVERPIRPINLDTPTPAAPSSSSSSGLLGNDLLSKLLGGSSAPLAKKAKLK